MAVKKQNKAAKSNRKSGMNKEERSFNEALMNIEKIARDRLLHARDPFAVGISMADKIREVAWRIEDEVRIESMTQTEAGYASESIVGVGIGVL